jgi:hypothetical protein
MDGTAAGTRRRRRAARAALTASLLAGLVACGDDGSDDDMPGDAAGARDLAVEEEPCAWAIRGDRETNNIAYPDTAATYWALSYDLAPDETLELGSSFPSARYASFITYGPYGSAIDVLTDRDIEPDSGSSNPFRSGSDRTDGEQRYTVVISPERVPDAEL